MTTACNKSIWKSRARLSDISIVDTLLFSEILKDEAAKSGGLYKDQYAIIP
jgi:hypothetical protein